MVEFSIINWLMVLLSLAALILKTIEAVQNWKTFSPPLKRSLLGNILVSVALGYGAVKGIFIVTFPVEITALLAVGMFLWVLAFLGELHPHSYQQKRQGDDNHGVGTWIKDNIQI